MFLDSLKFIEDWVNRMTRYRTQVYFSILLSMITFGRIADAAVIGLYEFNDANNLGRDTSGRGNHATSIGASYTSTGYQDGATSLDGSSYLRVPIDINPGVMPRMTWGAWVRPNQTNGIRSVISSDNGEFDRTINMDPRGNATWSVFKGTGVFGSGIIPSTTNWTFLASVYDQSTSTVTFYVDNQSYSTTSSFGTSWTFFDIGHNPSFGEYFSGVIDNVFVVNQALSSDEISAIRVNGFSAAVPEPSTLAVFVVGFLTSIRTFSLRKRTA